MIGSKELIDRIYKMQYSGGSQVQGHEAMEALRGLIYAPVALAIQSEVNEELVRRLNAGEIPHVRQAFLANAQSKVLLVEFDQEIAEKILDAAPKFGAAPHPVHALPKTHSCLLSICHGVRGPQQYARYTKNNPAK